MAITSKFIQVEKNFVPAFLSATYQPKKSLDLFFSNMPYRFLKVSLSPLSPGVTGLSELEGHLLVPYSTKANAFYGLHGSFFQFSFFPIHRRHLLLLNMVQGDAFLVLIEV